jgi:hypothetical protein
LLHLTQSAISQAGSNNSTVSSLVGVGRLARWSKIRSLSSRDLWLEVRRARLAARYGSDEILARSAACCALRHTAHACITALAAAYVNNGGKVRGNDNESWSIGFLYLKLACRNFAGPGGSVLYHSVRPAENSWEQQRKSEHGHKWEKVMVVRPGRRHEMTPVHRAALVKTDSHHLLLRSSPKAALSFSTVARISPRISFCS